MRGNWDLTNVLIFYNNWWRSEIGLCMENIPDDLRNAISRCTIIIAKGMANFESLSEIVNLPPLCTCWQRNRKPVADEVGVPVGSKIALLRT